jgi:uncharacterized damage-inducible protein DinB
MSDPAIPVDRFYQGWAIYNDRIVEVVRQLSVQDLMVRPAPEGWPIWATLAHTAGARVYWLCGVFGESGAETTPFPDVVTGEGWEDDLGTPRTSTELIEALETTWEIIDGCLQRWTVERLFEQFGPQAGKKTQVHTRRDVLIRLFSHDSYHCGELSQTLGIHGLPQIDLWRAE